MAASGSKGKPPAGPLDRPHLRHVATRTRAGTSRPAGSHSETTSTLETAAGRVLIRTRRFDLTAYVGGRGYVPTSRYEVAVHTAQAGRFVVVVDGAAFLDLGPGRGERWVSPSSHLEAFLLAADWVEATLARRERAARARAAVPPAEDTYEAVRRLMHVRGKQLERRTGEDWDAKRAGLCAARGAASSKELSADALRDVVAALESELLAAGAALDEPGARTPRPAVPPRKAAAGPRQPREAA